MPVAVLIVLFLLASRTAWAGDECTADPACGSSSVWLSQTVEDINRPRAARPTRPVNTLQEMSSALGQCWEAPPMERARPGTEITVLFSFKQDGTIFGKPKITFHTQGLSPEQRNAYFRSIAEMLDRCSPLPVTPGLGAAIAGRPFTKRFIDFRNQRKAEL